MTRPRPATAEERRAKERVVKAAVRHVENIDDLYDTVPPTRAQASWRALRRAVAALVMERGRGKS